MKTFNSLSTAAAVLSLFATSAYSDTAVLPGDGTFSKYGDAEGWTIFVDVERKSCLIERMDENANVVQMGLTADHKLGYVGVFSKTADLGGRGKEDVVIDLDGTLYTSQATKMRKNITEGYSGGYILANNPQFIEDVARKYTMTVFPEEEQSFVVDLAGTYSALDLARTCNAEQG